MLSSVDGSYWISVSWGKGALVFGSGYHPCKKIHPIRVVFQDLTIYTRTVFRGAKHAKLGEIVCFWPCLGRMMMVDKLRKNMKKCLFFRVCLGDKKQKQNLFYRCDGPIFGVFFSVFGDFFKHNLPKSCKISHFLTKTCKFWL